MRSELYNFLGLILSRPADDDLLAQTAELRGDGTVLGRAVANLAGVASRSDSRAVRRQFENLFIGLGRGEFLPYASYYLTGFLNEKPLARLRSDMTRMGICRSGGNREPEDNIASLMEMMSGLIMGRFGTAASLAQQREFFNAHLAPWASHFFSDLAATRNSDFYASVGSVGHGFMAIEQEAFRMMAA